MSRGVVYSLIARIVFILSAYAIHIYLARLLGPEKYGVFGVCLAVITVGRVFLDSGVRQVVSNSVANYPEGAKYLLRKGILIQFAISLILGFIIIALSKNIAQFLSDKTLENPLYLSALVIIMQSLFYIFMGSLNGLKRFAAESGLLTTYSIVRALAAILLVYFGMEVIGALSGLLIASFVVAMLGLILTHDLPKKEVSSIQLSHMLKESIPVIIMFGSISIIMNVDLFAVKYFIADGQFAGYYTCAAAISKVAYPFLVAFGVVLLPFVSSSYHQDNFEQTKKYVNEVLRYSLLITLPMVFLFSIYAKDIVIFVYGNSYLPAADSLKILVWGLLCLGLVSIFSNIMIAINKENRMLKYSIIGVVLSLALNAVLIPMMGVIGAAISTTISSAIVTFLAYSYVNRVLKLSINASTVFKIISSLLIIFLIACGAKNTGINFASKIAGLYIIFFISLFLFKGIDSHDINVIRNLVYSTNK